MKSKYDKRKIEKDSLELGARESLTSSRVPRNFFVNNYYINLFVSVDLRNPQKKLVRDPILRK